MPYPAAAVVATISVRGAPVRVTKLLHQFELHGQPLPVLDVIDLEAAPGEFIACLGPRDRGPDAHSAAKAEGDFAMRQDTDQEPEAYWPGLMLRWPRLRRTSRSMQRQ